MLLLFSPPIITAIILIRMIITFITRIIFQATAFILFCHSILPLFSALSAPSTLSQQQMEGLWFRILLYWVFIALTSCWKVHNLSAASRGAATWLLANALESAAGWGSSLKLFLQADFYWPEVYCFSRGFLEWSWFRPKKPCLCMSTQIPGKSATPLFENSQRLIQQVFFPLLLPLLVRSVLALSPPLYLREVVIGVLICIKS
jgi:hypothetical protein